MKRRVTADWVFAGVLLFVAAAALFVELFRWVRDGAYQTLPVAEIWLNINANTKNPERPSHGALRLFLP